MPGRVGTKLLIAAEMLRRWSPSRPSIGVIPLPKKRLLLFIPTITLNHSVTLSPRKTISLCNTEESSVNFIRTGTRNMGRNVGSVDKTIRYVAGIALLALSFLALGGISTTIGMVVAAVGVILFVTGLINFCPLFKIFGISSYRSS